MSTTTRYRSSYREPGVLDGVLELLSVVFPFFRDQEKAARKMGLRWETCSTPFVHRIGGRIVAHVGLLEMPLATGRGELTAGSVHAVATHPDHRRRGCYRAVMSELLDWCEGRYPTLQLSTDNPEYFESFGFRIVDEHHFVGSVSKQEAATRVEPFADPERLRSLLAHRSPVSHVLGVRDRTVFLFNEARHALHYARDLDAVLSFDVENGTLDLWDVVAERIPSLAELLSRIDEPFERVRVHFSPDRLDADLEPVLDSRDRDVLMVRGPYPPEGVPFKLPVPSRC